MIQNPQQQYLRSLVLTAKPSQLIVIVYDTAIRYVKLGIEGIQNKDIEKSHSSLVKAQSVIYELMASLDLKYPIAKQLVSIYEYMIRQLIQANFNKDKKPAEEVLTYLTDLREAWVQAGKSVGSPGVTHA